MNEVRQIGINYLSHLKGLKKCGDEVYTCIDGAKSRSKDFKKISLWNFFSDVMSYWCP